LPCLPGFSYKASESRDRGGQAREDNNVGSGSLMNTDQLHGLRVIAKRTSRSFDRHVHKQHYIALHRSMMAAQPGWMKNRLIEEWEIWLEEMLDQINDRV
jgi:hypothetical protein